MTISKRARFEILRRDNYACYYCHTKDAELTIDHVVPVTLGGTDDAENLVAACPDCNGGKSSTPADASLVAAVDLETAIYRAAQQRYMKALENVYNNFPWFEQKVYDLWFAVVPSYRRSSLQFPGSASTTLYDWYERGIPLNVIEKGVRIAVGNNVAWAGKWDYAAGVVRNTINDATARMDGATLGDPAYILGWNDSNENRDYQSKDLVQMLIDGTTDHYFWQQMLVPSGT